MLLGSGLIVASNYWVTTRNRAIVITSQTPVFAGPNTEFHELVFLKEGQQVTVVGHEQDWYKVQHQDTNGWIRATDIEETHGDIV